MTDLTQVAATEAQGAPSGQAPESLEEYQNFFAQIAPVLEKLDENPELIQAIIAGKMSPDFAKAALDGKLTISEAQAATAAVAEVKADIGAKAFENMDAAALSALVDSKVEALKKEIEGKSADEKFQEYTSNFIKTTQDFEKFSPQITEWLKDHPAITDVKVAYYAVKGELSDKEAKEAADADAAENAKNMILNASGGGVTARYAADGSNIVDSLIASRSNPNTF